MSMNHSEEVSPFAARLLLARRTDQQHRFVWVPDNPSHSPSRARRPITFGPPGAGDVPQRYGQNLTSEHPNLSEPVSESLNMFKFSFRSV